MPDYRVMRQAGRDVGGGMKLRRCAIWSGCEKRHDTMEAGA
jgi:hypothetical protein